MRKTMNFDESRNAYLTKLERLYTVNSRAFYGLINHLMDSEGCVGGVSFSAKTECIKLPKRECIYPATIFHPYYEVFILNDQKVLLKPESLQKHIELIAGENHFPQIILLASSIKNKNKIQSELGAILPPKTDKTNYNLTVITKSEFNDAYNAFRTQAIKDTLGKIRKLMN